MKNIIIALGFFIKGEAWIFDCADAKFFQVNFVSLKMK
jgi:hypothetical protein